MNQRYKNKARMYKKTNSVLKGNADLVNSKPKLKTYADKLDQKLNELNATQVEVDSTSAGVTVDKNDQKYELVEIFGPIRGALIAYAHENKRNDILALLKAPESLLKRMNDQELINTIKAILKIIDEIILELPDYDIAEPDVTELKTALDVFDVFIEKAGKGTSGSSSARDKEDAIIDEIDDILNNRLDNMIDGLRRKNPDFYNAYYAARVIQDLGGSHGEVKEETETPA